MTRRLLSAVVIVACLLGGSAHGAAYTSAQSGAWSDDATWAGSGVPGSGDSATIGTSTHVITLDQNVSGLTGLTITQGELTWGTNGNTLSLAGNLTLDRGTLTGGPDGVLEFDNSNRTFANNSGFGAVASLFRTQNTTEADRFTVRTVAGGTNAGMTTNNFDLTKYDLHHVDFVRFGNSSKPAILMTHNTRVYTQTFDDVIFDDNSGVVNVMDAPPVSGGWSITDCHFDQDNPATGGTGHKQPLILKSSTGTITGTRDVHRCTFDEYPALTGRSTDYEDNVFFKGWDDGSVAEKWAGFVGCFVQLTTNDGQNCNGDVTDSFMLFNSNLAAEESGTSTGSNTTSTINDTGKSWVVNEYQGDTDYAYCVEITGGTGVGQRRLITANTATALTVAYVWDVTPDATSTYAIVPDIYNNHGLIPSSSITTGTFTFDGVVAQSAGTDTQGDCLLHLDTAAVDYVIKNCITLPNAMGDSSGTLVTMGNTNNGDIAITHCTAFSGAQAAVSTSEGGAGNAAALDTYKSNIAWCDPSRAISGANTSDRTKYWTHGGCYPSVAITDTNQPDNPALGTQDIVTPANITNNCNYGVVAGFEGKGFNVNLSSAPDSTNQYPVDPEFVDPDRTFWSWAVTQGSTGDTIGEQVADGLAYIKADPTLTRTSLIPYIEAGLSPTHSTLQNAGHDSFTIGAVPGPGIQYVASTSQAGTANGATTSAIDTTGANLIVVAVSWFNNAATTVSDNQGNTWTALTVRSVASNVTSRLYYCASPTTNASHTFSVSGTSIFPTIAVVAVSGAAASPFDLENGATSSVDATSVQPGSITPSEDGCLVVTGVSTNGTSHSIDSGYTTQAQNYQASVRMGGGLAFLIQSTAAATNPTWSWTTASDRAATIASFKPASEGGSIVPIILQLSHELNRQHSHFDTYGVYALAP